MTQLTTFSCPIAGVRSLYILWRCIDHDSCWRFALLLVWCCWGVGKWFQGISELFLSWNEFKDFPCCVIDNHGHHQLNWPLFQAPLVTSWFHQSLQIWPSNLTNLVQWVVIFVWLSNICIASLMNYTVTYLVGRIHLNACETSLASDSVLIWYDTPFLHSYLLLTSYFVFNTYRTVCLENFTMD